MRLNGSTLVLLAGFALVAACNNPTPKPTPITGTVGLTVLVDPDVGSFSPNVQVRRGDETVWTITGRGRSEKALEAGTYTVVAGTPPTNYQARLSVGTDNIANNQITVEAGKTLETRLTFAQGFGSLRVSITPPTGVSGFTPSVIVKNAASATVATLTQSDTIDNLPLGSYSVEAATVSAQGVPWAGTPSGSPAAVSLSTTPEVTVSYAATRSVITVNLTGLGTSDAATLTLSRSDGTGTPVTQNRNGNGAVVFSDLAFASYRVRANSNRQGTYLDSVVGYSSPTPVVTANTNLSTIFRSLDAPMSALPFSGHLFVGGNGSNNNSGWTISASGATPYSVPGTVANLDNAWAVADSSLPTSGTAALPSPIALTGSSQLDPEGLFRPEFDASGNLYVIYQFAAGGNGNRIVRIGRANLEANQIHEGTAFVSGAPLVNHIINNDAIQSTPGSRVTDIAFDGLGNLWMVNEDGDTISCVNRAQFSSSSDTIARPNRVLVGSSIILPRVLSFDSSGNLWVATGRFTNEGGSVTYPLLHRFPANSISCPDTPLSPINPVGVFPRYTHTTATPDTTLRLNLGINGPVYIPSDLVLAPNGQAFWMSDFGSGADSFSSTGSCNPPGAGGGSITISAIRESVIKIPLSGTNLQTGTRDAVISSRITVGSASNPAPGEQDRGMQQASGVAFDSRGNLWVATNNNVEIDPTNACAATTGVNEGGITGNITRMQTDRRGKVYVFAPTQLADIPSPILNAQTPIFTLSTPTTGRGFTGIALNIPR